MQPITQLNTIINTIIGLKSIIIVPVGSPELIADGGNGWRCPENMKNRVSFTTSPISNINQPTNHKIITSKLLGSN
jgi:hypothetical protein